MTAFNPDFQQRPAVLQVIIDGAFNHPVGRHIDGWGNGLWQNLLIDEFGTGFF